MKKNNKKDMFTNMFMNAIDWKNVNEHLDEIAKVFDNNPMYGTCKGTCEACADCYKPDYASKTLREVK